MRLNNEASKIPVLLAIFIVSSAVLVTVVGYFDEGTFRAFNGFIDYILKLGVPPLSDYMLWAVIFIVIGFASFAILNLSRWLREHFIVHTAISALSVPILFFGLLSVAYLI